MKIFTTLMVAAAFLASATMASAELKIEKAPFGEVEGQPVDLYTLTNANGLVMTVTNYGGIVVSLTVPDKAGNLGDIVLGFSAVADYVKNSPYYGCIVGRYGNRIGKAKFSLDGQEYTLAANNGENSSMVIP